MLNKVYQSKFKGDRRLGNMTYNVSSVVVIHKIFRLDRRDHVKKLKRAHKQEVQGVIIEMGRGADKAGNTIGGRREIEGSFTYGFPSRY
jgi:hypothetical protein